MFHPQSRCSSRGNVHAQIQVWLSVGLGFNRAGVRGPVRVRLGLGFELVVRFGLG